MELCREGGVWSLHFPFPAGKLTVSIRPQHDLGTLINRPGFGRLIRRTGGLATWKFDLVAVGIGKHSYSHSG